MVFMGDTGSLALGGALGGIFVALIAPNVFDGYYELPIALVSTGVLAAIVLWNVEMPRFGTYPVRLLLIVGAVLILAGMRRAVLGRVPPRGVGAVGK